VRALEALESRPFDLVLLDIDMPEMSGREVLAYLRAAPPRPNLKVVMLSGRASPDDMAQLLLSGADDYLTKPFSLAELLARLRALVRRGAIERPPVMQVGNLRMDPGTRQVWRGDTEVGLSAREFALLETFMRRPGQGFSQGQLLDAAWDLGYEHRSNVVEVYIRYLREKIDRPFGLESLETVRGVGYRLRKDGGS